MFHIRNFCIIAHIDHGKSTIADRILEFTGAVKKHEMKEQFLDKMDLERERGITIKSQTARLTYESVNGEQYLLNLIDTPGHIDFTYEVSRSLSACEGALLVIDATQGIQAQTLANVYLALDLNITIIPVINKIDLQNADPEKIKKEIETIIGIDGSGSLLVSGKTGEGIKDMLEAIIKFIPPPVINLNSPLLALVFDSWFDIYRGVVVLVRIVQGKIGTKQKIKFMQTQKEFQIQEIGAFCPNPTKLQTLGSGEVGYIIANIKSVNDAKVGDTITELKNSALIPLPGFKEVKPMVFAGIFTVDSSEYENMKDALSKLALNDGSFSYEPETSEALGFGYRCGFLGLLHLEIIQERLEREFKLNVIFTAPTVVFKVYLKSGKSILIENPSKLPDKSLISFIEEPFIIAYIQIPIQYIGSIIKICEERRGIQQNLKYLTSEHALLEYILPMSEIVFDFFDLLKSISKGYGSLNYQFLDYKKSDLVKVDILLNGKKIDALSSLIHTNSAQKRGREICEKMREIIPKHQFPIAIQAAIASKVISRETISALRKDVTAKCYGGDITRKRKLLDKQKRGKKRMKQVGAINVPQNAFLSILKID